MLIKLRPFCRFLISSIMRDTELVVFSPVGGGVKGRLMKLSGRIAC